MSIVFPFNSALITYIVMFMKNSINNKNIISDYYTNVFKYNSKLNYSVF